MTSLCPIKGDTESHREHRPRMVFLFFYLPLKWGLPRIGISDSMSHEHSVYTPCSELRVNLGNDAETRTGLVLQHPGLLRVMARHT